MAIGDALLAEFDREMTMTRRMIERVPDARLAWKPHVKSMSLGELATHITNLPWWGSVVLNQLEFDMEAVPAAVAVGSTAEALERYDRNVAESRAALAGKLDVELMAPWALKHGGRTIFTMPRGAVWRSFVLNHLIHHRGQLGVYLRMNDLPVPGMYGPSADEAPNT